MKHLSLKIKALAVLTGIAACSPLHKLKRKNIPSRNR